MSKWNVAAALAIALLSATAQGQGMEGGPGGGMGGGGMGGGGMGGGKGDRHQKPPSPAEQIAKRKAAEAAYQKALDSIPESKAKADPWSSMR
jgi:hypothetical protein